MGILGTHPLFKNRDHHPSLPDTASPQLQPCHLLLRISTNIVTPVTHKGGYAQCQEYTQFAPSVTQQVTSRCQHLHSLSRTYAWSRLPFLRTGAVCQRSSKGLFPLSLHAVYLISSLNWKYSANFRFHCRIWASKSGQPCNNFNTFDMCSFSNQLFGI